MTFDTHYACLKRKKTKLVFVSIDLLSWDNENLNFHKALQSVPYSSMMIFKVYISNMYHYCFTKNMQLPPLPGRYIFCRKENHAIGCVQLMSIVFSMTSYVSVR